MIATKRADYGDFRLRLETMLPDGDGADLHVRWRRSEQGSTSYKVHINSSDQEQAPHTPRTGSLYRGNPGVPSPTPELQVARDAFVKPGEWFLLEVIVKGNQVQVRVKEHLVVDYTDSEETNKQGRFGLMKCPGATLVKFRKMEIKKLPPRP
jgi:hypothetical protein